MRDVDTFLAQQRADIEKQRPAYQTRAVPKRLETEDGVPKRLWKELANSKKGQIRGPQRRQYNGPRNEPPKTVLRRDPNTVSLSQILKNSTNNGAIIGLKYVVENIYEHPDGSVTYSYSCSLCKENKLTAEDLVNHVMSNQHRKAYITDNNLEEVEENQLAKRAEAINAVHGRGTWTVKKDLAPGLRTIDKSHLLKKVSKKDKEKEIEIETVDITNEQEDENPRLFVLKQIDLILDAEDLNIANDVEAGVIESIIQKMQRAMDEYNRKFGLIGVPGEGGVGDHSGPMDDSILNQEMNKSDDNGVTEAST